MRQAVTIIIPTRGRQTELNAAIASVMPQMVAGDELLVVDDGSDPPIELDAALAGANDIKVIRNLVNKGPAGARNAGIEGANNPVLAFLDADDLWLEGKLDAQLALLDQYKSPLIAIVSGWREMVGDRPFRDRIPNSAANRTDHFMGCWYCPGSTLVIRNEAFSICGLYDEELRRLEDYEWFLRFALNGGQLVALDIHAAIINRGVNNKPALVEKAVARVRALHAGKSDISAAEQRRMMAYLHLELAGAYWNAKNYLRTVRHIFTSLAYRPRLSLQLRNWWIVS